MDVYEKKTAIQEPIIGRGQLPHLEKSKDSLEKNNPSSPIKD